ncbi:MAG: ABC transporter permease [Limisphaerales bacterium]
MKTKWFSWLSHPESLLSCSTLVMLGWICKVDPTFLQWEVQKELSTHIWETALMALPMTLIILTGGIDLSIGSTMSLCAITAGMLHQHGVPLPMGCLAAALVGLAGGWFNGWFITRLKVHPLIITLATMAAFRGIAEGVSQARPLSGFPKSFTWLGQASWLGIPLAGWLFLGCLALCAWIMHGHRLGRYIHAIGYNEVATRYSGIRVNRILLGLYCLSGLSASIAAILFMARRNTAKADIGVGVELGVITAVVMGGVSIFGGRGSLFGVCLGLVLIHETREFVSWHWSRDELNLLALGSLLILSVVFQQLLGHKRSS